MTDLTSAQLQSDILELLGAHYDNQNIAAYRFDGKDIIVDLMNGNTLTISFRNYPEDVEK